MEILKTGLDQGAHEQVHFEREVNVVGCCFALLVGQKVGYRICESVQRLLTVNNRGVGLRIKQKK